MMNNAVRPRLPLILVFAIFLLVPSFDTALKYFGPLGVVVYFLAGTGLVIAVFRLFLPIFLSKLSEKAATYLSIILLIALAALALYLGPIANSGLYGGGSDADDALQIAANELANGRYPYYVSTYLGNRIGPMPGSILFAMPFALTGTIQLQNVFWLGVLFLAFWNFEKSAAASLALLGLALAFSPTVMQNIATGADYVSNTIFIMLSMWALVRAASKDRRELRWVGIIAAALLGVALSSRSTFILIMPLLLSVLVQNAGWKNTVKYLSISAAAFLSVTLPFWLYDPAGFAPLHVQGAKLTSVENVLPFARIILPVSAALLSIALSFQKMEADCARFFLNCAIVQFFILIFTAILYSLKLQRLDLYLEQSGYGMFTLFFGITAVWLYILRKDPIDRGEGIGPAAAAQST